MQVLVKLRKYKYKYIWKLKLGHINLIVSFSFPPTPPFCYRIKTFAPLVAESSHLAAYKVGT